MFPWKLLVPQCLNGACILGKVGNLGCSTLCTWLLLVSLPGWQLVFFIVWLLLLLCEHDDCLFEVF